MNAEIRVDFCVVGIGRFFTVMRLFSFPPSALPPRGRSVSCKQNRNQSKPLAKGGLAALVTHLHGRTALSRTRSEAKPVLDCGGLLCHTRRIRRKMEYENSEETEHGCFTALP